MEPYVVKAKSLAQAGFGFKATFRHHLIWAGIKELTIVIVEPRSAAKKAGLEVGEKIIQIRDVKVEGLGIGELKREFEKPSANGMIPLTIRVKDSDATRVVELQFSEPSAQMPKE
jgi:predicted metalloprotease with PDZ domain